MVERIFGGEEHSPITYGDGETAVLLVHSFPGTPAETRPLAAALADMGVTARSILLPGFGSGIASLSTVTASDWINAVRRELRSLRSTHKRVVLRGFSMGGAISICAATKAPPDALVLFAPFWTFGIPFEGMLSMVKLVLREVKPFRFADLKSPELRTYLREIGVDIDDPLSERLVRNDLVLSLNALDQLRVVGARAFRQAPELTMPTLVVQGRDDTTVTYPRTRRLITRIGGPVSYHEMPGHHHVLRLENPVHREEVLRVVRRFLTDRTFIPA